MGTRDLQDDLRQIESLNATIAAQAAEIKRLREGIRCSLQFIRIIETHDLVVKEREIARLAALLAQTDKEDGDG
jgi:hypothetical protein